MPETMISVAALACIVLAAQDPGDPPPEFREVAGSPAPGHSAWSIGIGVDAWTGFGEVFNDVIGPSVRLGYRIDDQWSVAVSTFWSDFDFEDPAETVLRQSNTPVADASIDLFMVSATARRHLVPSHAPFDVYVGAGVGFAVPDTGEAVIQPQVDVEVDGESGPEVHVALGGSIRVFESLRLVLEMRVMHSFTEYEVTDRRTGQTEIEEDWSAYGLSAGLEWRF
jgi:hypothetical protein